MIHAVLLWLAKMAAAAGWRKGEAWLSRIGEREIEITAPRSQEVLPDCKPLGNNVSYRVEGTLRSLPKNNEIWLLHQDEKTERVWPQGFETVQYDPSSGRWFGRVSVGAPSGQYVRIVAVVAPPTSQDFFKYFQRNGGKTGWEALTRIPLECRHQCNVQARVP